MANFLNLIGLATLLDQLKQKFSPKAEVTQIEADTDEYVLNIDYESTLAFDVRETIKEDA